MKISIITVNFHSDKWVKLLVDSIEKHTTLDYELVITDNSNTLTSTKVLEGTECKILGSSAPTRHWNGVEKAISHCSGKYVVLFDNDAHILRDNWDNEIIEKLTGNTKLVACKGDELYDNLPLADKYKVVLKPFRPFVMCFEREFFTQNNFSFKPYSIEDSKVEKKKFKSELGNIYFDVGIHFGLSVIDRGFDVEILRWTKDGYECRRVNNWGTVWTLNDKLTFYHHGMASRFPHVGSNPLCGRSKKEFDKATEDLFKEFYDEH